jgi:hypothetical protein
LVLFVAGCGGNDDDETASAPTEVSSTLASTLTTTLGDSPTTTLADSSTRTLAASTSTLPAPPPPTNPSTLEEAGVTASLLLDEVGEGPGRSSDFTPTGAVAPSDAGPGQMALARIRVEWACAPGGAVHANVEDGSGDIGGELENGFDGPIPTDHPPMKVRWQVDGSCSWHVRALDQ